MRSLIPSVVSFCKSSINQFGRGYIVETAVPNSLKEALLESTIDGSKATMSVRTWRGGAIRMGNFLREKIEKDNCVESQKFLDSLAEFAVEDRCRLIVVSNIPPAPHAQMLINASLFLVGCEPYNKEGILNPFTVSSKESSAEILFHTDQPGDKKLEIFSLYANQSSGNVTTDFIDAYDFIESGKLSEEQINILSQEAFFIADGKSKALEYFKIIDKSEDGKRLRINFDTDIRGFGCNFDKHSYPQEEIKIAVESFIDLVNQEYVDGDKIKKVPLLTGAAAFSKNDLHYRERVPRAKEEGEIRILTRTYASKYQGDFEKDGIKERSIIPLISKFSYYQELPSKEPKVFDISSVSKDLFLDQNEGRS